MRTCRLRFAALPLVLAALVLASPAAGSRDAGLAALQVALQSRGLYAGSIDGLKGPGTTRAIKRLQRRAGLPADGVPGPRTRRALGSYAKHLLGSRPLTRGAAGWDVAALQFLVSSRGFPTRIIDGYFGDETVEALRRYQRAAGLLADGLAGPATLASLTDGSVRAPAQPRPKPAAMTYVVKAGDSLTAIAKRFGTTVAALARANKLDPSHYLIIGTKLRVPAPAEWGGGQVRDLLDRYAGRYRVSRSLVRALAWQESGYQTNLTSPTGAWGVMQVMPDTWDFVETVILGERVPRTTEGNIKVGVLYLRQLLREFHGDERLAVGAWYQGAKAVRERGLYGETKVFVANVLALKTRV